MCNIVKITYDCGHSPPEHLDRCHWHEGLREEEARAAAAWKLTHMLSVCPNCSKWWTKLGNGGSGGRCVVMRGIVLPGQASMGVHELPRRAALMDSSGARELGRCQLISQNQRSYPQTFCVLSTAVLLSQMLPKKQQQNASPCRIPSCFCAIYAPVSRFVNTLR